uniref:Uncharacterized protein n=1 Tax=Anopheles atroparvus TaxID=41427 RepID=A0AAG5DBI4_ANOAO
VCKKVRRQTQCSTTRVLASVTVRPTEIANERHHSDATKNVVKHRSKSQTYLSPKSCPFDIDIIISKR